MRGTTAVKLDVLAFAPHPDDAEEGCGGFLIKAKKTGQKVGILDLTRGEFSENCTLRLRQAEVKKASQIIGVDMRKNLKLPDTRLENTSQNRLKIITILRRYRPRIILVPHAVDVHCDHVNTAHMVAQAAFLSEMTTLRLRFLPFRPQQMFFYFLNHEVAPSFILDISQEFTVKIKALRAFASQYSSKQLAKLEINARYWGQKIGVSFGEPFWTPNPVGIADLGSFVTQSF